MMPFYKRKYIRHCGYTLIEMLTVIAIIGIIIPAIYYAITMLYTSHAYTFTRAQALVKATNGVSEIVRDVRSAVYAENGALPIVDMATSSFTFYADTDFDGTVERVRYTLNGENLEKGVIEPDGSGNYSSASETTGVIATDIMNVQNNVPVFRYYTATSTEITDMNDTLLVKRVVVELIAASTYSNKTNTMQVQSSASIRNLKDVY